ncbi:MAG TPA: hypothetical protein VM260_23015, partial [Pirellula sp.]|nr:hypothetical protein [Pirellula sp.]
MNDSISIRYGKGELHIRLPQGCEPTIIRKPDMPVLEDPLAAIRDSLSKPVDAPSFEKISKGVQRA